MGRAFGKRSAIRAAPAAIFYLAHIARPAPLGSSDLGSAADASPGAFGVNVSGALSQTYPELSRFQSSYSCIAMANIEILFNSVAIPIQ